jgi:hypothetical protein
MIDEDGSGLLGRQAADQGQGRAERSGGGGDTEGHRRTG